jgi:molecular chaperone GrpE
MDQEEKMPAIGDEEPRIVDRRSSQNPGGEENGAPAGPVTIEDLTRQLEEEKEKAQSYFASWQRAAADYQNFKRRVDQEREELSRFASAALIINVLPLIDDLERALQNVDSHLAGLTWVDGIRLIHRKFQGLLEAAGVQEIHADGADFDPTFHEAVAFGQGEDGKVVSVVQKGYTLGGRVIRPAMVVVGKSSGDSGPAS